MDNQFYAPKDRGKDRKKFDFSSDKKSPGWDPKPNSKFADWSEDELWKYLGFLNNKPKPEDLEENPGGGYRA